MSSAGLNSRVFAIGDVHGCAQELRELLALLNLQSNDTVVFLGDYIDRGPDSRGVVDLVLQTRSICQVVALKGNHESMFLDFLDRPESVGSGMFVLNGGSTTLVNYQDESGSIDMPRDHLEFFRSLVLFHETAEYFFVHAGVPDLPLSSLSASEHETYLMWARQPFLSSGYDWGKTIVHGHTPARQVEFMSNRINVDTGCVFDGLLTAIELNSREVFQVHRSTSDSRTSYMVEPGRVSTRFSGRLSVSAVGLDGVMSRFETLNFNQFGMLMKDASREFKERFSVGEKISGAIGTEMRFEGEVVRMDQKGFMFLYGVKITKLDSVTGEGFVG